MLCTCKRYRFEIVKVGNKPTSGIMKDVVRVPRDSHLAFYGDLCSQLTKIASGVLARIPLAPPENTQLFTYHRWSLR
jgi:hypothetical protein